jgi:hypothetical protein
MYSYRIITFMAHEPINTPQRLIIGHSRVISYQGKHRVFTVRKVFYDDDMTPMYSEPTFVEPRWTSLVELKKSHPNKTIWDYPILDKDNYLCVWNNKE